MDDKGDQPPLLGMGGERNAEARRHSVSGAPNPCLRELEGWLTKQGSFLVWSGSCGYADTPTATRKPRDAGDRKGCSLMVHVWAGSNWRTWRERWFRLSTITGQLHYFKNMQVHPDCVVP